MKTRVVCSTLSHCPISCGGACGTAPRSGNSTPGLDHSTMAASPGTARGKSIDTSHTQILACLVFFPAFHLDCMTPKYACRHTPKAQGTYPEQHSNGHARKRCNNHNYLHGEHCEPCWMCECGNSLWELKPVVRERWYLCARRASRTRLADNPGSGARASDRTNY